MLVYSYHMLKNLYGIFLGPVCMQHGSTFAVSTHEVFRGIPLHDWIPELTLRWTTAHFQSNYCKQKSLICIFYDLSTLNRLIFCYRPATWILFTQFSKFVYLFSRQMSYINKIHLFNTTVLV